MSAVQAWRWSADAYETAAVSGVFGDGARVELIGGEVYQAAAMLPRHATTVRRLRQQLAGVDAQRWTLDTQTPVRLSASSEPEPDLWVARGPLDGYLDRHPTPADLVVVVEVADTSLAYDRGVKLPAYATALVGEVWIVSLPEQCLHRYLDPIGGRYQTVQTLVDGALTVAGVEVAIQAILPPAE
ncbi:MAG: Uma2 family endonuclease [Acidimicrobiales bacterium]